MKPYPKYKDSGVQWIGKIPNEWNAQKIKNCLTQDGEGIKMGPFGSSLTGKVQLSIPYKVYGQWNVVGGDFQAGTNTVSEETYQELIRYKVEPEELLISMMGTIGKCAIIPHNIQEGIMDSHIVKVRLNNSILNSKYFLYVYDKDHSNITYNQIQALKRGSIMDGLNSTIIKNLYIPLPPLKEQQAIVAYLDDKTSKMDECIRLLELQKADLIVYQHSMLVETVTHGKSGVSNTKLWEKLPLRHVCEFRNGYTPSKNNHAFWENGTIPWYRMDDIRENGRKLKEAKQYITPEAVKGGGLFEAGSFILATTATIGEHALLIADSLANQRFTNLKIRKSLEEKLLREFFFYYLFYIDDVCKTITRISTFPAVDMEKLRNIMVCIPPLSEQKAIVDYLDTKTAKIDETIRRIDQQIDDLRAYRTALISDVVTGKMDVRNAK